MKVLIIGLGKIGLLYDYKTKKFNLTHSQSFSKNKNFNLIGGVDNNVSKLKLFEKKYKAPGFKNVDLALKSLNPDLIVISTNTNTHLKVVRKIFSNKIFNKIILCEKPCGSSIKDIRKIYRISKKFRSKIYVNYMRSTMNGFNELKEFVMSNRSSFNGITFYRGNILNDASHYINLFQNIFGKIINHNKEYLNPKSKNLRSFSLYFKKGVIKFIHLNNVEYNNSRFDIFFNRKSICYNSDHDILKFSNITKNKIYNNSILNKKSYRVVKLDFKNVQMQITNQIDKMKKNKKNNLVSIENAIDTMKIITKLHE